MTFSHLENSTVNFNRGATIIDQFLKTVVHVYTLYIRNLYEVNALRYRYNKCIGFIQLHWTFCAVYRRWLIWYCSRSELSVYSSNLWTYEYNVCLVQKKKFFFISDIDALNIRNTKRICLQNLDFQNLIFPTFQTEFSEDCSLWKYVFTDMV